MLIGPPYKILDSLVRSPSPDTFLIPYDDIRLSIDMIKQYGPGLNVEGKRIFVFNRRILSDTAKEPQRIRLMPYEVAKPDLSHGTCLLTILLVVYLVTEVDTGSVTFCARCSHIVSH
jgi:hypothetical protein